MTERTTEQMVVQAKFLALLPESAHAEYAQAIQKFGAEAAERLARQERRISELLQSNNELLERARSAERQGETVTLINRGLIRLIKQIAVNLETTSSPSHEGAHP